MENKLCVGVSFWQFKLRFPQDERAVKLARALEKFVSR